MNNFKPINLEFVNVKKKWSIPLLIITLAWLALSFISPFAVFSPIACVIYILVPLGLIVTSVVKRETNKIGLIIVCNVISVLFNCAILFTHFSTSIFTGIMK